MLYLFIFSLNLLTSFNFIQHTSAAPVSVTKIEEEQYYEFLDHHNQEAHELGTNKSVYLLE